MITDTYKTYWKKGWIPALVIAGVCIYLLKDSWLKWGSPIIDTGRELYVPWKLLSGSLLYRDIAYEYGPLAPYFNAFLCMIFGVHIHTFIISGMLSITLSSLIIYKISRIFLRTAFAAFSVITFLFVFAFGQYYYSGIANYVLPYTYASTYGIMLALFALFFYYRALMREKNIYWYICSLFTTLALLTRIGIGAMLIVSIFSGVALDFKKLRKKLVASCIAPVLTAGFIYAFFAIAAKSAASQSSILDIGLYLRALDIRSSFTGKLMGTLDLSNSLMIILRTVLYYLGISAVFFIGGWVISLARRMLAAKRWFLISIMALLAGSGVILFQRHFFPYNLQYRPMPIICILLFVIGYRRYLKRVEPQKYLFLVVFSIFSGLLLTRMLFNVWVGHYGFYLLLPGLLCYYFFFLKIIPEASHVKEIRNFYRLSFVVLSASFIMSHTVISSYFRENRTLEVSSPRGAIRVFPSFYRYKELLDYIRDNTSPSASLVVFPEGVMLNFLSLRENPMSQYAFVPRPFLMSDYEKEVIAGLEDNKIRYVVLLVRDTSEHGARWFGVDYAQGVAHYLGRHYNIEKTFGPFSLAGNEPSFALLKRTEAP